MHKFCQNPLCKNHDKSVSADQLRVGRYCRRVNGFLENNGFVVIGKNTADPNPQAPFEAWSYNGPMDFQNSEAVTFGLGVNCCDAISALDEQLADTIKNSGYTPCKTIFVASHQCVCKWKCPECEHVINWSYRQLADAGSPCCPRCKNQVQMVMEAKPSASQIFITPCDIGELMDAAQNVIDHWTTGHLAESVRELDRVVKELKK